MNEPTKVYTVELPSSAGVPTKAPRLVIKSEKLYGLTPSAMTDVMCGEKSIHDVMRVLDTTPEASKEFTSVWQLLPKNAVVFRGRLWAVRNNILYYLHHSTDMLHRMLEGEEGVMDDVLDSFFSGVYDTDWRVWEGING